MKYCPNCKRDFEDGVAFCRFCEIETVDSLDEKTDTVREKTDGVTCPDGSVNGEKVCIMSTYDVLNISQVEKALKAANIPVEVRQSVPVNEDADEDAKPAEADEETAKEERAPVFEEPKEETKTGFFAKLFGRKPQQDEPERHVIGVRQNRLFERYPNESVTPVFDDELFDVIVPAEFADEARRIADEAFGIIGAEDYGIDNGDADEDEPANADV